MNHLCLHHRVSRIHHRVSRIHHRVRSSTSRIRLFQAIYYRSFSLLISKDILRGSQLAYARPSPDAQGGSHDR